MKARHLQLENKDIIVFDQLLSEGELSKVLVVTENLRLVRKGITDTQARESLHYIGEGDLTVIRKFPFYEKLSRTASEILGGEVECDRIIYREFVFGDQLAYHTDSLSAGTMTGIVYLNSDWKESDRGETLFLDNEGIGISILPRPERGILFDGRLTHSSTSPSRSCYEARKLLVFNFHRKST